MPGPADYYGRSFGRRVHNWQIDEVVIDNAVRRILRMVIKSGRMDRKTPVGSVNTTAHQTLARELAEQSIVLCKNKTGILPLKISQN